MFTASAHWFACPDKEEEESTARIEEKRAAAQFSGGGRRFLEKPFSPGPLNSNPCRSAF